MPVAVVKCQGMFKPGEISPLLRDSPPPSAPPTSDTNSTALKYESLNITGSSQDAWSPARIRAAEAEAWAFQETADRIEAEESAAWAKHDERPEPGATDDDIRIYTKLENGEYKYWGVKDLDETMEAFRARIDPENIRELVAKQGSGPLPTLAKLTPSPTNIRAGDAEYWIPQRAAEPAEDEESTTWATAHKWSEPSAIEEDAKEPLEKPVEVWQMFCRARPQDLQ